MKHIGKLHSKRKGQKILKNYNMMLTEQTYWDFMDRFTMDALSLFEYEGLPDHIDPRYIEKTLFYHGNGVWFEHESYGLLFQPANLQGENIWDRPTTFQIQRRNLSYTGTLEGENPDGIVMYNNPIAKPTVEILSLYAYRLTQVERTIDVNIHNQKTPVIIEVEPNKRLSLKNLMNEVDEFNPVIHISNDMFTEGVRVHDIRSDFIADKLMEYKHDLENDIYTMLGVGNANTDKKERMIVDEVNANNDQIEISIQNYLEERQLALDKVNEKFGTNISVKFKLNEIKEEVLDNGDIHNNNVVDEE